MCVLGRFSHVQLFMILWTVTHQAPLSVGLSRQEHWSKLPFPPPGDLPDPGIESASPVLVDRFFTTEPPGRPLVPDMQLLIWKVPFSLSLPIWTTRSSWLSAGKASDASSQFYFRGISPLQPCCHHLVHRDLDHLLLKKPMLTTFQLPIRNVRMDAGPGTLPSLLLFSCSVVSNSLRPHRLQHICLPCPSLFPRVSQTHVH